jgi:Protein of unknown function (DUF4238)
MDFARMPLDHYVSQVHLRQFCSPERANHLCAIRKADLKSFFCHPRSVCRIEGNSTNHYLHIDRVLEEFLKDVEPKYNAAIAKLRDDQIDDECIYAIAGFVTYVTACAPAATRIFSDPLRSFLMTREVILERKGLFEETPEAFGGRSLSDLLADGTVKIKIDQKFPQALGINSVIQRTSIFGNSRWEILFNDHPKCPFFTSDFPVAIEETRVSGLVNRIVPLAPDIAVRIIPDVRLSRAKPDLTFQEFSYRRRVLGRPETLEINRLIVRCAEDFVFYRDNHEWVEPFVAKNRQYHLEAVTTCVPQERGFLNISAQRIMPCQHPKA